MKELKVTPKKFTFEGFCSTQVAVKPERCVYADDKGKEDLDGIDMMLVYGANIFNNGKIQGGVIEKLKNGKYHCEVYCESILTTELKDAERFLYEKWYE